ncbi:hypothetical protein N657DRAFT_653023 [Parathielavia appendiculata]|uniref:Fungal-specific transcription factor domain-containing protein n=1 Tax=Parathielavia appendiculata TaxID=2587402 RepID=A0AAN6Z9Y1_9PEZI|nr:hypothetical protein N657DRAFT_653023 [Parathielavia appendiculata]
MTAVFEAIEYYNMHIAPTMVATGVFGEDSPYWMPASTAPLLPRSFTQNIVCTSLAHRILQSSLAAPSHRVVLAQRLQRHRGCALRALTAELSKPEHQTSDLILASIILLLLVEIQHAIEPPDWRHHIMGATVMIDLRGGLGDVVFSRPHLRHLFRYYVLLEIIGNTTSPHVDIDSARRHLEVISLLPVLFGNGLTTCFPCPPDLLAEIIRINHLRSRFHSVSVTDVPPAMLQEAKHAAALDILRRIKGFPTDRWAAEVLVGLGNNETPASQAGFSGWHAIATIYQSAIAIYCMASLFQDVEPYSPDDTVPPDPWNALTTARRTCASVLLSHLREVSRCPQLRKLGLWPLFVAGVEAEDEATKRFIAGELQWISNALGGAAPLVAKDLLEKRVWRLGTVRRSWDGLFDQSYVFVI